MEVKKGFAKNKERLIVSKTEHGEKPRGGKNMTDSKKTDKKAEGALE